MKELEFARHLDFIVTFMEHFETFSNSWLHSPRTENRTILGENCATSSRGCEFSTGHGKGP